MHKKRKYCFTFDLRRPWGVSPLLYGIIQVVWIIVALIIYWAAAINGYGDFELTLILSLVPSYGLAAFKIIRWIKWGWLINPIGNACSTNQMIVLSKPAYRTIFGYMRREIAPSFDVYQIEDGEFELRPNSNGSPNFDSGLMDALSREMPDYIVYVKHGYPFTIGIKNKKKGGKPLHNDNFL